MNCFLVLAFIASLLLYGTTVDARNHGNPASDSGFHERGSIGNTEDEIRAGHYPFKFFGVCSRSYRPWQPWLPDFLKNISSEGVREFCNIATNENLTKADSEQQLEQWAQSQGVQEQFKEFMEERKQKLSNIQQKMQELIVNVSRFISELETIHSDTRLTRRDEKEKVLDLVNMTDRAVLALAKKVRAEAGFLSGERRWRPCPRCRPQQSYGPQPPLYHRHSSGTRVRRRAPFGQGARRPFGQHGNSQQGGPLWQNGSLPQGGPFGPNGNLPQGWPSGQNGIPPQGWPSGQNGNLPQGWPSGQNGIPPQGGPFGPNGTFPQGWPSGQNGNLPQGWPSGQNGFPQLSWPPGQNGIPPQGGPFGPNGTFPQGWPSGQNGNLPQGWPSGQNGIPQQSWPPGQNGNLPRGWPSGQNGNPSQSGPFGANGPYEQNGISGYRWPGFGIRK